MFARSTEHVVRVWGASESGGGGSGENCVVLYKKSGAHSGLAARALFSTMDAARSRPGLVAEGLVCPPPEKQKNVKWVGERQQDDPKFQEDVVRNLERHCLVPKLPEFVFKCVSGSERVLFPYQRVLNCLVGPNTPVQRALVAWMTGAGKTVGIVTTLDNYYDDPRPKVVLFPNKNLVNNFMAEFVALPTRYGDFVRRFMEGPNYKGRDFVSSRPELHKWTCSSDVCKPKGGTPNVRTYKCSQCNQLQEPEALQEVQDLLELKGRLGKVGVAGFPLAPVRAMAYRPAGGTTAMKRELPALKFAHSGKSLKLAARRATFGKAGDTTNPYNHCIVLCDEAHTLLVRDPMVQYQHKRDKLREWLYGATDCTLVAFTATPVPEMATAEKDYRGLMRMVKGARFKDAPGNTGFILYYNFFTTGLFPSTVPDLNTCNCLGNLVEVPLQGHNLVTYIRKHHEMGGAAETKAKAKAGDEGEGESPLTKNQEKLFNYCNMSLYAHQAASVAFRTSLLADPVGYATKLAVLTARLNARPEEKTLVIVHRSDGFRGVVNAMSVLFGQAGVKWGGLWSADETASGTGDDPTISKDQKQKAAERLIKQFNDFNPSSKTNYEQGGQIRVLVVEAQEFSEGVSFFGVRRVVLLNPPKSYKDYLQRIGRAFRACQSHIVNLDPADRTVAVDIYVSIIRPKDVAALREAEQQFTAPTRGRSRRRTPPDVPAVPAVPGPPAGGAGAQLGAGARAHLRGGVRAANKGASKRPNSAGASKRPNSAGVNKRRPSRARSGGKAASLQGLSAPPDGTMDVIAVRRLMDSRDKYLAFVKAHFADVAMDAGLYDDSFVRRGPHGVRPSELEEADVVKEEKKAQGDQAETKKAAGEQQAKAKQAEEEQAKAQHAEGEHANTKQAEGEQAEGEQAEGEQAEGEQAEGKQAERAIEIEAEQGGHRERADNRRRRRRSGRHGRRRSNNDYYDHRRRRSGRHGRRRSNDDYYDKNDDDYYEDDYYDDDDKYDDEDDYEQVHDTKQAGDAAGTASTPRQRGVLGRVYDWWTGNPKAERAHAQGEEDKKKKKKEEEEDKRKGLLGLGGRWYTLGLGGGARRATSKQRPRGGARPASSKQQPARNASSRQRAGQHASSNRRPARPASSKQQPARHAASKQQPARHASSKQRPARYASSKQQPARHAFSKQQPARNASGNRRR